MKLSIVVPIFKVEEYLPRCLDSILGQTFTDFELILVEDGSPDHCGEIMEAYARDDSRIVTIHQKNGGVSAARNAGLHIARGKYIGFVDPDDYIAPARYELVVGAMEQNHAQLGICNFKAVDAYEEPNPFTINITNSGLRVLNMRETAEELFHVPPTIYGAVWNKLFIRELITTEFDTSVKICEDNLFLLNYVNTIEKSIWLKAPLYYMFNRPGSATRSGSQKLVESLDVREKMCQIVKESSFSEVYEKAFYSYIDNCANVFMKLDKNMNERGEIQKIFKANLTHIIGSREIPWKEKLLCASLLFK